MEKWKIYCIKFPTSKSNLKILLFGWDPVGRNFFINWLKTSVLVWIQGPLASICSDKKVLYFFVKQHFFLRRSDIGSLYLQNTIAQYNKSRWTSGLRHQSDIPCQRSASSNLGRGEIFFLNLYFAILWKIFKNSRNLKKKVLKYKFCIINFWF